MTELPPLAADDFPAVFEALHGHQPFPWQAALARKVCEQGRWPSLLDIPTGAGKTTVLDIALFHLAVEADKAQERRAPLRIALVVDRRIVVDDAFRRAEKIVQSLQSPSEPALAAISARLQHLAGEEVAPVQAHRLRGGLPLDFDWARSPCQPLLITSTVDQVGSRLLFRGYGVSARMRPVHAGLIGSDCLILIDEAHLAEPFRQTLDWVAHCRHGSSRTGGDPWGFAILSATPGDTAADRFTLTEAEKKADPEGGSPASKLRKRLSVPKPARLAEPSKDLAKDMVQQARDLLALLKSSTSCPAIAVMANRVGRAREIFQKLRDELQEQGEGGETEADLELLIDPSRPLDRKRIVERLEPIRTGSERDLAKPLIVVATQCLEVGADLDFDGLVSECAALDALRQRFGRVNRKGRDIEAAAVILAAKADLTKKARKDGDPVYGAALAATWDWLQAEAEGRGAVDFGIEALDQRLAGLGDSRALFTQKPNAPVLCPAHLDLLLQTHPAPEPDLDIGLFLHGPQRATSDVQVVWRGDLGHADLEYEGLASQFLDTLAALPPRTGEVLRIPIWALWGLLAKQDAQAGGGNGINEEIADTPHAVASEQVDRQSRKPVIRWAGPDDARTGVITPAAIRPGDTLVLPTQYGGCDEYGWAPDSEAPVRDLADEAAAPFRHRNFAIRLHAHLLAGDVEGGDEDAKRVWAEHCQQVEARLVEALADAGANDAHSVLDEVLEAFQLPLDEATGARLAELKTAPGHIQLLFRTRTLADGASEAFAATLHAPQGLRKTKAPAVRQDAAQPSTEADALGVTADHAVSLDDHCRQVERVAQEFAGALGLDEEMAADIATAACLHDLGKLDPRFQLALRGGRRWNLPDDQRILAKSGREFSPSAFRRAKQAAGLPERWRHEALSVDLAPQHPRFADATDKALVLYLIGTHHGYGRPLFLHRDQSNEEGRTLTGGFSSVTSWQTGLGPQHPEFDFQGHDWPALVAALAEKYGPWRLALMEAVLRLADHWASAEPSASRSGFRYTVAAE
jgi:CRISPR-associated endonuclease/helicase Cas3